MSTYSIWQQEVVILNLDFVPDRFLFYEWLKDPELGNISVTLLYICTAIENQFLLMGDLSVQGTTAWSLLLKLHLDPISLLQSMLFQRLEFRPKESLFAASHRSNADTALEHVGQLRR